MSPHAKTLQKELDRIANEATADLPHYYGAARNTLNALWVATMQGTDLTLTPPKGCDDPEEYGRIMGEIVRAMIDPFTVAWDAYVDAVNEATRV